MRPRGARDLGQQRNRHWIDDIEAEGMAIGETREPFRAKRA